MPNPFVGPQDVIVESRPSFFKEKSTLYAHIETVVAFLVVKLFSCLLITSHGAGVSGSKFGRHFLLGLLYLPIPTRAGLKSTRH